MLNFNVGLLLRVLYVKVRIRSEGVCVVNVRVELEKSTKRDKNLSRGSFNTLSGSGTGVCSERTGAIDVIIQR